MTSSSVTSGVRGHTRQILATTLHSDWTQFEPLAALRCTTAVAIPLIAGSATGYAPIGVFGAIGAVSVGFGSFQGAYRSRASVMLWAALCMAVSIVLGSLAGHAAVPSVLVAVLWGFASGWLVALGPAASFVGLQSAIAAILAQGFAATPAEALTRGAIVFAGGLVQILLVVLVWPLRRYTAERQALGALYRSLAAYAVRIPSRDIAPPEPNTLVAADAALGDPQPFARSVDLLAFRALVDEAERIRAGLAALATYYDRLIAASDQPRLDAAAGMASEISCVLAEIARSIEAGTDPAETQSCWSAIDAHAVALAEHPTASDVLRRRLHAAWRTSGVLASEGSGHGRSSETRRVPLLRRPPIRDAVHTLRANLSLRSEAFRHGVRVAATLGTTTALHHALSLPRGYWVTLTALIVLKPEFQNTFARGVGRVAGTLVGAVLATAIAAALQPGHGMLIVLVLGCVWAGYAAFRINYVAFSMCITGYVVFLLGLAGLDQRDVVVERVFDTLLGGGIALIAYALWPTWSGAQVQMLLADLLEAHARYTRLLLAALAEPARFDATALARARSVGRLLRSNTEAAIDRLVGEPAGVQAIDPRVALGVLAALRRGALAALALHSALEDERRHTLLWLAGLGEDVGRALMECAAAMRSGTAPPQPAFRLDPPPGEDPWTRIAFAEAEMIADSAATVAAVLTARQAGSPRGVLSKGRP